MQELSGRRFGNYRLQHLLGQGGFADVYLGEHIHLHTQVAIKVLHIRVAVESLGHFLHEAQVVAQLDHPHIVRVFEFDVVEGIPYLVMTYAPFGSMRQRFVRSVSRDPAQVLPYVQQVASALQYAHDRKLIHRDVKPENILLGRREEVLLSDFGLVLLAQSSSSMRTEEMAGTVSYMAPEQIQGRPRLASDQYALGITVYEWLCGERPFNGHFVEIASQHTLAQPPSLCQRVPGLAPAIEAVVFKALAKVPEERYPSVLAFADALTAAVQHAEKVLSPNLLTSNVPDRPVSTPLPPPPWTNEAEQTNDGTVLREPQQTLLPPTQEALFAPAEEAISTAPGLRGQQVDMLTPTRGPFFLPSEEEMSTAPALHAQRTNFLPRTQFAPTLATDTLPPGVTKKTGDRHSGEWERQRRPRRRLFIRAAIILGILLLCTGLVLTFFQTSLADTVFASTSATVTVTPDSQAVQATYTASAVTGTLDPTQPQIQARKLSATSSVSSTAVPASGQGHTDATYAHGTVIACYYGSNIGDMETIPAGTVVTDTSAPHDSAGHTRTIKVLGSMTVLRTAGSAGACSKSVQAQYMYPGSAGNIREYTNPDGSVTTGFDGAVGDLQVANGIGNNFSGGQDASDYTYVQQSDIAQAMNNLASKSASNAQPLVSKQLHANERLVGAPTCQTQTSTNHTLNDHAASVTATKTSTCSGEAYDYTAALNLANQQVRIQATTKLGPGYGLQGTTQLTLQSAVPAQNGTTQLTFQARGTLVYQISAAQKHSWQQALQRKSKDTAGTWLREQPGVNRVTIVLDGWNQQSLPASASNITIVIASPA